MRFRLWPWRQPVEPSQREETASLPPPAEEPEVFEPARAPEAEPERPREPEREESAGPRVPEPEPEQPVPLEADAEPEDEGPPSFLTLTIDEAKATIKEAGGDVIQVGFLASAYRRHLDDDPQSAESAAARKRLGDLVAKRLKDRGLLAPDGTFELQEKPEDLGQRA
jgi:hypothetical protein